MRFYLDKQVTLCSSEALLYEINRIPDETRRHQSLSLLSLASEHLLVTDAVESLAVSLEQSGLSALDAVHLACASLANVDYFCTTDDRLLRRAQSLAGLGCKVITLSNLVLEVAS